MSAGWLDAVVYLEARTHLLETDLDARRIFDWSENGRRPPESPEKMASEVIWVILCAGRSAQAARTIEAKVWKAIGEGRPVVEAFGYRAKATAIERAWRERSSDFEALQKALAAGDDKSLLDWCHAIPFIGDDTSFQLMKNFGVACAKPDIWMCRLAGIPDRPRLALATRFERCMQLARELSAASGDSIPVVDSLCWLACNKGLIEVRFDPYSATFRPPTGVRRSIYTTGPDANRRS